MIQTSFTTIEKQKITSDKPPNKSLLDEKNSGPDIDEMLKNLQGKFKLGKPPKNFSLIIILALALVWLSTGVFIVDP